MRRLEGAKQTSKHFPGGLSPKKVHTAGITFQLLDEMESIVELQPVLLALGMNDLFWENLPFT